MMKRTLLIFALLFIKMQRTVAQSNGSSAAENNLEVVDSIYSNILKESREFWVKLPENFNPEDNVKYPVIYLLDGFSLKSTLETVYNNYWGHYLPHMILVGVSNRNNRTRDLTISQVETRHGGQVDTETGGADKFGAFLEKELIPFIDAEYPTTPYRTLIGHSYGGLFTIDMFLKNNALFKNYLAIDPSLEWDNQLIMNQVKQKLKTEDFSGKGLFISLAAEQLHMQNENITIENIMEDDTEYSLFARSIIEFSEFTISQKQNRLKFSWKVYPEDLHGTVPLPAIRDGLIFLFDWYQFKSPQKYNNPETTVVELRELIKVQELIYTQNFGYKTPPMIEELFNGYGYMYLQMEQLEKAKMFFELAIKYYPNSANVYDALADYYEAQKDYTNALKLVTKAFEISGSDYHKNRMESLKN